MDSWARGSINVVRHEAAEKAPAHDQKPRVGMPVTQEEKRIPQFVGRASGVATGRQRATTARERRAAPTTGQARGSARP